jgi:hypothetical protein
MFFKSSLPEQPVGVSKGASSNPWPSTASRSGLADVRRDPLFLAFPFSCFCERKLCLKVPLNEQISMSKGVLMKAVTTYYLPQFPDHWPILAHSNRAISLHLP